MPPAPLRREVSASLSLQVDDPTAFVVALSLASGVPVVSEELTVTIGGEPLQVREGEEAHGTRLVLFETVPGDLEIRYAATAIGLAAPAVVEPFDPVVYLRPSRYVQSDSLTDFARDTFPGLDGADLVREVGSWVHGRLDYVAEASSPTGGAVETLDSGAGVCRDYAHLTAALLRALDVPARLVSVYAPELDPMDFHAVVEALVEESWVIVDSTRLAPRSGMVRIATGRDAADTAFVTNTLADVQLLSLQVDAHADQPLSDDPDELIQLG